MTPRSPAEAPAPVFLICSERSGSNLIASIMGAHGGVYAHPPYHLGRDLLGPLHHLIPDGPGAQTARQVLADHAVAKVRRYRGDDEADRLANRMNGAGMPDPAGLARFVWQEMPAEARGRVAFVKENNVHHLFPLILTAFPDARFVFQVRDPRDFLASAKARRRIWLGNKFGSLRRALEVWRADQQAGLAALGHMGPGRVFILRYEDLLSDTDSRLRALCAFCGLPFDPAMLSFHQGQDASRLSQTTGARENLSKPLMTGNFQQVSQDLVAWRDPRDRGLAGRPDDPVRVSPRLPAPGACDALAGAAPAIDRAVRTSGQRRVGAVLQGRSQAVVAGTGRGQRAPVPAPGRRRGRQRRKGPGGMSVQPSASPIARILERAIAAPEAPALELGGAVLSYGALVAEAAALAARLPRWQPGRAQPRTLVAVERHFTAYIAILAAQLRGHAHVPVDPAHPAARNAAVLAAAGADTIVSSPAAAADIAALLEQAGAAGQGIAQLVHAPGEAAAEDAPPPPDALPRQPQALAYILFTSGSTGTPKGVPITLGNLCAYLDAAAPVLPVAPGDRLSQTFTLTFDLSVHDIFVSLTRGATLVVPTHEELQDPAAYITDRRLTHWFSVPSLAYQMRLRGALQAGAFPGLRNCLFCGEVLPWNLARDWMAAAPRARVENWYGPTEATIACARHPLPGGALPETGDVPIGHAMGAMQLHVLDGDAAPQAPGQAGELYLSGPQLATGYLDDPGKTAAAFVTLPDGTRAYRTGDRAARDPDGTVRFLGRLDNQVKLRGYRIELGEVEAQLRRAAGGANAVAIPWPQEAPSALVAAVEAPGADADAILAATGKTLPGYMLPAAIYPLASFPRNPSGKVDRKALAGQVAALASKPDGPALSPPQRAVMDAILAVAPGLSPARIIRAANLLDAGMDSLAFVSFTMEVERRFGVSIDEATVVHLSEAPFDTLVADLGPPQRGVAGWAARLARGVRGRLRSRTLKPRANRALQFIERFDAVLQQPGPPLVLAVGSSGVFRAFSPEVFAACARARGHQVRALNVGLPAVDIGGLRQVCEFIRDRCRARGRRLPLVIWEFDPMHVSVSPPRGDIALGPDFFSGVLNSRPPGSVDPEFEWRPDLDGIWQAAPDAPSRARRPNWTRERDALIASAYLGRLAFSDAALSQWRAGAAALAAVSDRVLGFVHPADRAMLAEAEGSHRGATAAPRTCADTA